MAENFDFEFFLTKEMLFRPPNMAQEYFSRLLKNDDSESFVFGIKKKTGPKKCKSSISEGFVSNVMCQERKKNYPRGKIKKKDRTKK